MRRIEINTPQNVPILYQLASVRERMIAFFLDALILTISLYVLFMVVLFGAEPDEEGLTLLQSLILFPLFMFYSFAMEVFGNGQSIGKRAMKIKVVKLTGMEMSLSDYMLRWAFRWIDIWGSLGAIAALKVSSSDKGQRLGDVLADTTVVRLNADFSVALKDLLAIKSTVDHEVMYPEIRLMKEEEMLLIKAVLDQYRRYPNEPHANAVRQTAASVAERIGLEEVPKGKKEFLLQALTDYVTVTRSA